MCSPSCSSGRRLVGSALLVYCWVLLARGLLAPFRPPLLWARSPLAAPLPRAASRLVRCRGLSCGPPYASSLFARACYSPWVRSAVIPCAAFARLAGTLIPSFCAGLRSCGLPSPVRASFSCLPLLLARAVPNCCAPSRFGFLVRRFLVLVLPLVWSRYNAFQGVTYVLRHCIESTHLGMALVAFSPVPFDLSCEAPT